MSKVKLPEAPNGFAWIDLAKGKPFVASTTVEGKRVEVARVSSGLFHLIPTTTKAGDEYFAHAARKFITTLSDGSKEPLVLKGSRYAIAGAAIQQTKERARQLLRDMPERYGQEGALAEILLGETLRPGSRTDRTPEVEESELAKLSGQELLDYLRRAGVKIS